MTAPALLMPSWPAETVALVKRCKLAPVGAVRSGVVGRLDVDNTTFGLTLTSPTPGTVAIVPTQNCSGGWASILVTQNAHAVVAKGELVDAATGIWRAPSGALCRLYVCWEGAREAPAGHVEPRFLNETAVPSV